MQNKKKTLTPEIQNESSKEKKTEISRRSFLKRSAYSAPVLMAMGQLAKPTSVNADGVGSSANGPSGPPTGWNPNP